VELLVRQGDGFGAVCVRLRDRLATLARADSIDRALAVGVSPELNVDTALRARVLTDSRTRRRLARGLDRAIAGATEPAVAGVRGARVNRSRIRDALAEIAELRRRLLADGLTSVQGIARARILLTDGAGPLYNPHSTRNLRETVRDALAAFDLTS
jgi:hypothetical protein